MAEPRPGAWSRAGERGGRAEGGSRAGAGARWSGGIRAGSGREPGGSPGARERAREGSRGPGRAWDMQRGPPGLLAVPARARQRPGRTFLTTFEGWRGLR